MSLSWQFGIDILIQIQRFKSQPKNSNTPVLEVSFLFFSFGEEHKSRSSWKTPSQIDRQEQKKKKPQEYISI